MKNSVKVALAIVFLAVGSGLALSYCTRPEKPAEDTQNVQIDTAQNQTDSTAQKDAQDTATVK